MKEYRITKDDILQDSPDDCYLAPTDPIHELKIAQYLGGLGAEQRLAEYRASQQQPVVGSNKRQIEREQGIKPGTKEWFELHFKINK